MKTLRGVFICVGLVVLFSLNWSCLFRIMLLWEDMLPFKKLIAISELVLLTTPSLVKFSA